MNILKAGIIFAGFVSLVLIVYGSFASDPIIEKSTTGAQVVTKTKPALARSNTYYKSKKNVARAKKLSSGKKRYTTEIYSEYYHGTYSNDSLYLTTLRSSIWMEMYLEHMISHHADGQQKKI